MKEKNLLSILTVTWGLLLVLQQSLASYREDDKTLQSQLFLGSINSERKAPEVSYGDFDLLSEDLLVHQLLPRCDHTIIQVNRSLFTLVTGYTSDHIFDQGFEHRPTRKGCCIISNARINFRNYSHNIK